MRAWSVVSTPQGGLNLVVILGLGICASLGLTTAGFLTGKWSFFIIFLICCISGFLIIPDREKFLLFLAVILMSVSLDFHPYYLESDITPWPVAGFRISIFDVAFFFLMIAWMFRLVMDQTLKTQFYPWITIPFVLLWFITLASNFQSQMPGVIKCSTAWMVLEGWLIFLYFANNVKDRRMIYYIVAALLLSGIGQSLLGLGQYLSGSSLGLDIFGESKSFMNMRVGTGLVSRVAGTFGHPNNLAGYLNMLIMINLALLFAPLDVRYKFFLAPVFVLTLITEILTLSRGAWIALCVGGLVTLFLCFARRWQKRFIAFILAAMLLICFSGASVSMIEPLKRRLFEEDYGAAQSRIPLIIVALNIIAHHPGLGVGLTNYTAAAPHYDISKEAIATEFPRPVHNEFLLIASELGLPALAVFLAILLVLLRQLGRLSRNPHEPVISYLAIGLFGTYVGWCIFRLTDYTYVLLADPFWIVAGLTQAMTRIAETSGQ